MIYPKLCFDSSWFFVRLTEVFFQSKLFITKDTNAFLDVLLLVLASVQIAVKHGLKISIMPLVARPLVVDGVREQSVEAEANQKWFADLGKKRAYVRIGVMVSIYCAVFGKITISSHEIVKNTMADIHLL